MDGQQQGQELIVAEELSEVTRLMCLHFQRYLGLTLMSIPSGISSRILECT